MTDASVTGKLQVDADQFVRVEAAEGLNGNLMNDRNLHSQTNAYPMSEDDNFSSGDLSLDDHEDSNSVKSLSRHPSIKPGYDSDDADSGGNRGVAQILSCLSTDLICMPPEPANKADDTESITSDNMDEDDDDDYGDGRQWNKSSLLSDTLDVPTSHNPEEERQKAMIDRTNRQFKILVSRLLTSAGVSSTGEEGGCWTDVVASLAWDAARLIKPDAGEGKEMDPATYLKVKCVASGSRDESKVINGLVFKKSAAHKHMPTNFRNPRLLLLKGVLGHSDVGLSSFSSMEQEKDQLEKAITKMIEVSNPNVILVEKTVSRDIQELILKGGVTLVLDMKLHRLERIARCTDSSILSFMDVLSKPKLKQCEYFHIEKFLEEHNADDNGKKPSKMLMFLEGFPRPLGCTVLLRGATSEELKKVKQVVQYAVYAAYHLILETTFFEDQRVFLNEDNAPGEENAVKSKVEPLSICEPVSAFNISAPISPMNGNDHAPEFDFAAPDISLVGDHKGENALNSSTCADENLKLFSGKVDGISDEALDQNIMHRYISKLSFHTIANPSGKCRHSNIYLGMTTSQNDYRKENGIDVDNEIAKDVPHDGQKVLQASVSSENLDNILEFPKELADGSQELTTADPGVGEKAEQGTTENIESQSTDSSKERVSNKDEIDNARDAQSILILMSSQSISKQTVCEQSHLSRIKYYLNFDVSLGRYLRDLLHNKSITCDSCGEPPETHIYSYTHRNGNLTVEVRRLPPEHRLSGELQGKIWMWTRCSRCERENGIAKSTPRVVLSKRARNLSFGKFLELSFAGHASARRQCICGHSLHRDCLRFFGLGSKVAIFRYSPVEIYLVCKPPQKLEFPNSNWQYKFKEEIHAKGIQLFSEVSSSLQELKNKYPSLQIGSSGESAPFKEISEVEEMLALEKADFEDSYMKIYAGREMPVSTTDELLQLNLLYQVLLLELYIWDKRLDQLLWYGQHDVKTSETHANNLLEDGCAQCSEEIDISSHTVTVHPETSLTQVSGHKSNTIADGGSVGVVDCHDQQVLLDDETPSSQLADVPACSLDDCIGQESGTINTNSSQSESSSTFVSVSPSDLNADGEVSNAEEPRVCIKQDHHDLPKDDMHGSVHEFKQIGKSDDEKDIWTTFSESRSEYVRDIQSGYLENFYFINRYAPQHLSSPGKHTSQEVGSMHFTVAHGGYILPVCEDEISSIISRALAITEDLRHSSGGLSDNDLADIKGEPVKAMRKSTSLLSESSSTSNWSSSGSFDSEASSLSFFSSLSSDEFSSTFDNSPLLANVHPEIIVNGKVPLKGKYSVTCVYANQFYALRKKCCPSEVAYIASLSRCKNWDAQGGKSKAYFAKSIDERFIIKQIKKTEFESFLKFAPDYFKHVSYSLDTGSQTCLAKILGIYQVRQVKNGKEVKTDLMVMENLLFGHDISRTYDLKGAVFSRYIADSNNPEAVYLDQNFIDDMRVSPIYIGGRTKHLFQRAIWNDTSFLTSINVMDYSLLVGVDKQHHELVFGIIDYLRQYTWDKQLETWVKTSLVVPKNVSPTVISPKEYKKRFRKFMTKYFLTVPDTWIPERWSGS